MKAMYTEKKKRFTLKLTTITTDRPATDSPNYTSCCWRQATKPNIFQLNDKRNGKGKNNLYEPSLTSKHSFRDSLFFPEIFKEKIQKNMPTIPTLTY